jgi:hypothetical protein
VVIRYGEEVLQVAPLDAQDHLQAARRAEMLPPNCSLGNTVGDPDSHNSSCIVITRKPSRAAHVRYMKLGMLAKFEQQRTSITVNFSLYNDLLRMWS